MLTHLDVHNYTLVDNLDIELQAGLTTLTGETGAGKSLLLDAIGLAIGNKARGEAIHDNGRNAEVSALFDVSKTPHIAAWLQQQDIPTSDNECLLKRVITPQGRSRCSINGRTTTLTQLQELGKKLVNIHGQHEHQALLSGNTQRRLLDTFGAYPQHTQAVSAAYQHWRTIEQALYQAQALADAQGAQYQLLKYQVEELTQLALQANEVQTLETQQKRVANAEATAQSCAAVIDAGRDSEHSIESQLNWCIAQIQALSKSDPEFNDAHGMLQTALINTEEAINSIDGYLQKRIDEELNLNEIENRLSQIYTVARKHKVKPESLFEHQNTLIEEFEALDGSDEQIANLKQQEQDALASYHRCAEALQQERLKAAKRLSKAINSRLKALNMEHASFQIEFNPSGTPSQHGNYSTQFLISTIPNKPPGPLHKIASGGELSRIGLAIQVVTAAVHTTPTLIFDEVDAGIGGTTGDTVGHLLRELGDTAQVLCVTHLAQVASKAHNHLNVQKVKRNGTVYSSITPLAGDAIIAEISRMVGGPVDSEAALAHARQMVVTH
ncbi:MAG TPA: DNA repair protein RecN [Marinagarivorans sp.]